MEFHLTHATVVPKWFIVPCSALAVTCLLEEKFVGSSVIVQTLAVQGGVLLENKTILDLTELTRLFIQNWNIGMMSKAQ